MIFVCALCVYIGIGGHCRIKLKIRVITIALLGLCGLCDIKINIIYGLNASYRYTNLCATILFKRLKKTVHELDENIPKYIIHYRYSHNHIIHTCDRNQRFYFVLSTIGSIRIV